MYLAYEMTELSLPQIARGLKRIDHTTIMHGIKAVRQRIEDDAEYRVRINDERNRIERLAGVDTVVSEKLESMVMDALAKIEADIPKDPLGFLRKFLDIAEGK